MTHHLSYRTWPNAPQRRGTPELVSPNKYTDTLNVLPDLIVDAEHAVYATENSPEACHQASEVYQLARAVLKHDGRADLVPLVCDRAMRYAE
ncbi:MAG: hypothetical protein ACRDRS_20670 [Pseudonocardiaceae bacterium]